jgi:hypothetical protein
VRVRDRFRCAILVVVTDTSERPARFGVGSELIMRLLSHLCEQLDGCLGVGLSSGPSTNEGAVIGTVGIASELDHRQWSVGSGPVVIAAAQDDHVVVEDLRTDDRWPEVTALLDVDPAAGLLASAPVVGLVAVPGGWSQGGLIVLTVYLDHAPKLPDLRVVESYEPLIATTAAVVEFCAGEVLRTNQVLDMVQHRRVIEQAKGIVMARTGCDGPAAFSALVRISQQANIKIRDFSVALVQQVGNAPAEQPERELLGDDADTVLPEPNPDAVTAARTAWDVLRQAARANDAPRRSRPQ